MNILIVTDIAKRSHSVLPELYVFICWAKADHDVTIMTPPTEYQDELQEHGIRVVQTFQKKKISWRTISLIRKELNSKSYQIIYATNSKSIPSAAFAAIGIDVKLVCYRGTVSGLYRFDPTSYLTVLNPRVDAVVCVSRAVQEKVKQQLLRKRNETRTIYKGHLSRWYEAIKPIERKQLGIPEDSFLVVVIANFRRKKGLDILLKASHRLASLKQLHFVIVGRDSDKPVYERMLQKNPMQERIHRLGFRDNALEILAASDLLVQASTGGEGLPRTVVEAMFLGIPPVTTTTGGAKEIIEHGKTGYVVPVKSDIEIAKIIVAGCENRDKFVEMGKQCKKAVADRLSADRAAEEYISFFEELTDR